MYKINNYYQEFISNREGIIANLTSDGLTLIFLWKNPNEVIQKNFKKAPFFQLFFKNEIMFLLLKFENIRWIDVPCVFTETTRKSFSNTDNNLPCTILLANSNTGKVFSIKKFLMPKGITKAFIQNVHTQKDIKEKAMLGKINTIRSSFSSSEMSRLSLGSV